MKSIYPTGVAAMTDRTKATQGKYLYAIISASEMNDGKTPSLFGRGISGEKVSLISNGKVAAVVSDAPNEKIRPDRRNLASHNDVLKLLMAKDALLPMTFGVIADSAESVRKILTDRTSLLEDQLNRVRGKVEMGLRVFWEVPNIFEYFVNTRQELKDARDRLFRGGRQPTQNDKIELGRLFDRILTEDRAERTQTVVESLTPRCFEIRENKPRNEREIMNLACLIARDGAQEFEKGVFEAAKCFDDTSCFDYNGPWPPQNFVDVTL